MRKDGDPLEVWLKTDDEIEGYLVGWMTDIPGKDARVKTFIRNRLEDDEGIVSDTYRSFDLSQRVWEQDRMWFMDRSSTACDLEVACRVPGYAHEMQPTHRDVKCFEWMVLQVEIEDYEWIFDLPQFEPVNTPDDHAAIAERLGDLADDSIRGFEITDVWVDDAGWPEPTFDEAKHIALLTKKADKIMSETIMGSGSYTSSYTETSAIDHGALTAAKMKAMMAELPPSAKYIAAVSGRRWRMPSNISVKHHIIPRCCIANPSGRSTAPKFRWTPQVSI